jgi:cytochrome c oxidase subunit 2
VDSSVTSPTSDLPGRTPELPVSKRPRRRTALLGVIATAFLLTGCTLPTFGAYKGSTTQGQTERELWQGFFVAGLVVGGFVLLLILYTVIRYRRRSDEMPRQTQYHTLTEIIYTVSPIVIVLVLFVFTVLAENKVDATPTPTDSGANIHVNAFQWGWEFVYPGKNGCESGRGCDAVRIIGQTTQAPTMMVPVGTATQITLKSLDVLHGFYVPAFNFSRYAAPDVDYGGRTFNFNVLHAGVYRGQCTQLCGLYHSLMFFNVKAVPQAQFDAWLSAARAQVRAHPSSVPQLPSGVNSGSGQGGSNQGSGTYQ